MRAPALSLVLGAVLASSAAAQKVLLEIPDPSFYVQFGEAVAFWPDLDGDGLDDVAVGIPILPNGPTAAAGAVVVYSSRDGSRLFALQGDQVQGRLGGSLARLGDVDGDGVDDVAVGEVYGAKTGRVHVLSGATGGPLQLFQPKAFSDGFGQAVAHAGDWDGDGWSDVAVGDPIRNAEHGWVYVYSGRTGQRLFAMTDPSFYLLGHSLAGIGDVNGDGLDDLLVGAPGGSAGPAGAVVIAGGSGAILWRHHPAVPDESLFGLAVRGLGDVDLDGRPDYAIGAPTGGFEPKAFVAVYSGATHARLWVRGHHESLDFGTSLTAVGDLDLDGVPELVVGQPGLGAPEGSSLSILSGATGARLSVLREPSQTLGSSLASGSDVNGDGLVDLLAGRPFENPTASVAVISPR